MAFRVAHGCPGGKIRTYRGRMHTPSFCVLRGAEGRSEVQKAGKRANTRIEQENACMELSGHRGRYKTGANAEKRQMPK